MPTEVTRSCLLCKRKLRPEETLGRYSLSAIATGQEVYFRTWDDICPNCRAWMLQETRKAALGIARSIRERLSKQLEAVV